MDKEETALTLRVKPRGEEWQGMFWKGSCLGLAGCGAAGSKGLDEAHSVDRYHSSEHCGNALSPKGCRLVGCRAGALSRGG